MLAIYCDGVWFVFVVRGCVCVCVLCVGVLCVVFASFDHFVLSMWLCVACDSWCDVVCDDLCVFVVLCHVFVCLVCDIPCGGAWFVCLCVL